MESFDQFAGNYKTILDKSLELGGEKGEYFSRYKARYVRGCVGRKFAGKILDYGCGVGLLSADLVRSFPRATVDGLDVSGESIRKVPSFLRQQGTFTSDENALAAEYDLIVIANVLHHVEAAERNQLIARLKKRLKRYGRIIIFEHNPLNPLTRKVVRESPLDKGVVLLPSSETYSYLEKSGYQNIRLNYIVFFPKSLSVLRWSEPLLSWLPFGAQYAAVAQYA